MTIQRSPSICMICTVLCISLFLPGATLASTSSERSIPADPLNSVMWSSMAERFFIDGTIVFDQRVKVMTPSAAEDQFQVPVTVDATALETDGVMIEEIVAVADLNPIPHILTVRPIRARAFVGFRVKLQQSSPVHVGVKTSDGVWHVNGAIIDAAGGGCTAPAMVHGTNNWMSTLGQTRAISRRESADTARLSLRMQHPMDTGLAANIPVFYMSDLRVTHNGEAVADVELFEPISENPSLTLKPLVGESEVEFLVQARDTEGHEFDLALTVPAISN